MAMASYEQQKEYEVFLSFRGSDIRKTFMSHLYHGLKDAGIYTFMDDEELRVGEEIGPRLMKSIKQSKIGMPIFSADYASSKWCLMEVAEMVKSMKEGKQLIMPIFYNVSVDDVQHQTGSYANPFTRHEKRFGREKVQEWKDALREVVKLKGLELAKVANGEEGAFTKLLVARVIRELNKSYLEIGDIHVGMEDQAEELLNKLQVGIEDVRFIGIWGMGGIGKTTLAKYVYNQVMDKFECHSFLQNIRETARYKGLQSLQSKLVADILRREKEDYFNVQEGVSVLKERLRGTKALILLDDVDHIDQLKALAANICWFGRGSRIIITSREKQVLDLARVKDLYLVEQLEKDQALELFCRHAFGDKSPRPDLVEPAKEIVNITGGLPLALEVYGSFLSTYAGKRDMWLGMIEKLKRKPDMDVQAKLMISYESLERHQQEIFLDIACYFIGMDVRMVSPMWNNAKYFPEVGIEILQLKSLIKIEDDHTIWMHDQLRDLGRSIVEDMDNEPGRRSRIWHSEDASLVLYRDQRINNVTAISLKGFDSAEEEVHLSDTMFRKMRNLKILELGRARLYGNFQHLLDNLRWLSWQIESDSSPKNLDLKNLIVLDLSGSLINEHWIARSSIKIGMKLKVLNLSYCPIRETPNFSAFPSLEILILESCRELECIDPSIELLKNLILLNLRGCFCLKWLPNQMGSMESLTELIIDGTDVTRLPIMRGMKKLQVLSANDCYNLHEIPASVGSLSNLKRMSLSKCFNLREVPDSLGRLTSLVELDLSGCSTLKRLHDFQRDMHYCLEELILDTTNLDRLPRNLACLKKLKVLYATWSVEEEEGEEINVHDVSSLSSLRELVLSSLNIKRLPKSLSSLSCLQNFHISCINLQVFPELPSCLVSLSVSSEQPLYIPNLKSLVNLKGLRLDGDFMLKKGCLSHLRKLEMLDLSQVNIRSLSEDISSFTRLKQLQICSCQELCHVPTLPPSLLEVNFSHCESLRSLPEDISSFPRLKQLYINNCEELHHVPTLPPSLLEFTFENCGSFEKLPDLSNLKQLSMIRIGCPDVPKELPGLVDYLEFVLDRRGTPTLYGYPHPSRY